MRKLLLLLAVLAFAVPAQAQLTFDTSGRLRTNVSDGSGSLNTIVDSGSLTCNAGTNLNTSALLLDATFTGRFPAAAAVANGELNPTVTRMAVMNMVWNTASWDRWTGGVTLSSAIPAGTNNIGDVDVLTLPALPAGSNDIGEVRVADSAGNQIDSATAAPAAAARGLVVRQPGPCKNENKSIAVVNISTATTTLVITGVASQHVYVCSIALVTAAANNVAFIAGTGATCATSSQGMNGGTTAASGWNFAANGGLTHGSGEATIMSTNITGGATGDSVCIVTSAATQLSGTIGYVIE